MALARRILTLALATSTVLLPGMASSEETVRVGFGTTWPTFSHLELARVEGLLGDLSVDITVLEDPLRGYQMLAAGQLDVLFATLDYAPIAASQDLPFKLVSAVDISYGADQIVLAPGLAATDLKGAKVGATQGFVGELFLTEYLTRNGLKPSDVEWLNISPDQISGPMLNGDIKAAYIYEPWTSGLEKALPGTQRVLSSDDPKLLASGILEDALYISDSFLATRAPEADKFLKAYFDAVELRGKDPAKGNAVLAEHTKWPVGDIEAIVGANGKFAAGGMYVLDFDESARQCGVLDGEGPLGQPNGLLKIAIADIEDGWIARGTLKEKSPALLDVLDCSIQERLLAVGYRSAVTPPAQ
jgi:NitT/TauT family transport system substrate-binding protein